MLHACRTITELRLGDAQLNHDVHVLTQVRAAEPRNADPSNTADQPNDPI